MTQNRWASRLLTLAVVGAVCFASVGCRTVGGWMGKKDAQARSGTMWNVPAPFLEPPPAENRTVYVNWRNMSDAQGINLTQDIKSALTNAGYQIVEDPQGAYFRLRAMLRYYGENEALDGGATISNRLGVIAGAAAGAGIGGALSDSWQGGAIGGAVGGVGGSLVATGINNRMKAREYVLIIDMVLEEYNATPVEFTVNSASNRNSATSTGVGTVSAGGGANNVGGGQADRTGRTTQITQTSNYFPHGMRMSAWARQIGMLEDEALPLLEERVSAALPNVMP